MFVHAQADQLQVTGLGDRSNSEIGGGLGQHGVARPAQRAERVEHRLLRTVGDDHAIGAGVAEPAYAADPGGGCMAVALMTGGRGIVEQQAGVSPTRQLRERRRETPLRGGGGGQILRKVNRAAFGIMCGSGRGTAVGDEAATSDGRAEQALPSGLAINRRHRADPDAKPVRQFAVRRQARAG